VRERARARACMMSNERQLYMGSCEQCRREYYQTTEFYSFSLNTGRSLIKEMMVCVLLV